MSHYKCPKVKKMQFFPDTGSVPNLLYHAVDRYVVFDIQMSSFFFLLWIGRLPVPILFLPYHHRRLQQQQLRRFVFVRAGKEIFRTSTRLRTGTIKLSELRRILMHIYEFGRSKRGGFRVEAAAAEWKAPSAPS